MIAHFVTAPFCELIALFFSRLGKNLIYMGFIILMIGVIVHFPLVTSILVSIVLTLL